MNIRVMCIGDVVGHPGCSMIQKNLRQLKKQHEIDAVIVNGENSSAQGRGITPRIMSFLRHNGADVVTSGNHIWQNKEIFAYLDEHQDLLRPINFPHACPGKGITVFEIGNGITIGVINVQGRIFMREHTDCPFRAVESALSYLKNKTSIIIVDVHAEATSEKIGLAHYVDGKVSAVFGTHTHVQTADERILPGGTAFISDLGMVGALNGMLGMKKEPIIQNFLTQLPVRFTVDEQGPFVLSGIIVTIDSANGKAIAIERIRVVDQFIEAPINLL